MLSLCTLLCQPQFARLWIQRNQRKRGKKVFWHRFLPCRRCDHKSPRKCISVGTSFRGKMCLLFAPQSTTNANKWSKVNTRWIAAHVDWFVINYVSCFYFCFVFFFFFFLSLQNEIVSLVQSCAVVCQYWPIRAIQTRVATVYRDDAHKQFRIKRANMCCKCNLKNL